MLKSPYLLVALLLPLAWSALAVPAPAQGGYLYSPAHVSASEGLGFSYLLGAYPDMHYQMLDGDVRGKAVAVKEIALRLDYRNHSTSSSAAGRRYSSLALRLADGDAKTATTTLSRNLLSTPTLVFDSALSWPDFSGTPLSKPTTWGGGNGGYRLPFKSAWSYSGKTDLASDWQFRGGTLQNKVAWSTTQIRGYWWDSYGGPDATTQGITSFVPSKRLGNSSPGVTGRCNDSHFGAITSGAYCTVKADVYGPYASNPAWRNHLVLQSASYFTAPGSPVLHAWGVETDPVGLELGTGCNRLHMRLILVILPFMTQPASKNPSGASGTLYVTAGWVLLLENLKFCFQAAWSDSQTNRLSLSQACSGLLPGKGPPLDLPARTAFYSYATGPVSGPHTDFFHNPALRYAF